MAIGKPRLLDLFCGAGGASVGYSRAGFEVVGVDIAPQPNYPYEMFRGDALSVLDGDTPIRLDWFDCIHASPPCQEYTTLKANHPENAYPDLYEPVRDRLTALGVPWVIENVIGAPYRSGFVLCGSMFDLRVRRHRNFETSFAVLRPACEHKRQGTPLGVYGHGGGGQMTRGVKAKPTEFGDLMGMPWAKAKEISQAIPPLYTQWIGERLLEQVKAAA